MNNSTLQRVSELIDDLSSSILHLSNSCKQAKKALNETSWELDKLMELEELEDHEDSK